MLYECAECGETYEDPTKPCDCGCLEFRQANGKFDADELGIDPEVDAERYDNA